MVEPPTLGVPEDFWECLTALFRCCAFWALFSCGIALVSCMEDEPPACQPTSLALIEANYINEALKTCAGRTYDTCPELEMVRAKYQVKRQEWVQCQR